MRPSSSLSALLPLLLLLLHQSLPLAGANGVEFTCNGASARTKPFNYQLCVDSLNSDPTNVDASTDVLAVSATRLSLQKVQAALNKAASLQGRDPSIGPPLGQCVSLYNGLQEIVQAALNSIQNDRKAPAMGAAKGKLLDAMNRSRGCPSAFSNAGKQSPMARESSDATDMLQIAAAIIDYFLTN